MPPVIAILPAVAGIVATALGATALVSAIVVAVATIAATVAIKLLTPKPKTNRINQGAELQTKIYPALPRQVLCGETSVGPSVHFTYTYTDDSEKPNRYLLRVLQISDQPITSLLRVREGKEVLTFTGDVTTGWYTCSQHRKKDGAPAMWLRVYNGTFSGAVADATLISASGGLWTSAHKGTGLCYAIVKYDYDADAFSGGEPELIFDVQGARCYDDRKDSTVPGGAGAHRLNDPTTWEYTENAAIITAQYLRGFNLNGKRILGVGADARDLASNMLFSAYNTCAQTVATATGTMMRYPCAINMSTSESAETHLTDLSAAMDGKIFDRGGSITIWPGAVRTPVLTISEQDIDWTAEKSWQPRASLSAMLNAVSGNFVDKDSNYQERDLPLMTNATWETNDGGERFQQFISLKAVNNWSQGNRILHRTHQSSRFSGTAGFVGGIWLLELEQGDWFQMNNTRWGFTNKLFEVQELTLTQDMRVAIIAQEVATSLDDWAPASDEFDRTDTVWNAPPYNLVVPTFTLAPYSFYDTLSGVQDFGFQFTLVSPLGSTSTYGEGVEIQYALTSNLAVTYSAGVMTLDQVKQLETGLLPGTSYSVRARTTGGGRYSDWSAWQAQVTTTANTAFASALAGIASDNVLTADEKRTLLLVYTDIEQRYNEVLARSTAVLLTTTALTNAHTNWLNYLASLSPAWNDTTQSTTIYTGLFADQNFTTGWSTTSVTVGASGAWITLQDSSGAAQGRAARSVACAANTQYSAGILIKKDAVGNATRNVVLTLVTSGGTAKTASLAVDTSTGAVTASGTVTASGSSDLGDSWWVYFTFTTNTGNNNITYTIYPAGSTGLSTTLSNTPQGTVSFLRPVLAAGDVTKLGADALIARETDLVNQIEAYWNTISQTDGATSVIIDPIPDTVIYANSDGTVKTGELTKVIGLSASAGIADVSTLGVWSMTATSGITATINAGTGDLSITAFAGDEVFIPVQFVYAGITRQGVVHVIKQSDAVDTTGGGTGGGGTTSGGTSNTAVLGDTNATGTYDLTNAASAILTCTAGPLGKVSCNAGIYYKFYTDPFDPEAEWSAKGKWQWRVVGGTFADISTEVLADTASISAQNWKGLSIVSAGHLGVVHEKTGLTPGTDYEFKFVWRTSTSGQDLYKTSGSMAATGS